MSSVVASDIATGDVNGERHFIEHLQSAARARRYLRDERSSSAGQERSNQADGRRQYGEGRVELTGKRVRLREFVPDDVGPLHAIHSHPFLLRYYAPDVGTLEFTNSLVTRFVEWANESPRQNFQLAIVEGDTETLVGSCGVRTKGARPGRVRDWVGA